MPGLRMRTYLVHDGKIERVGLNCRRPIPDLAGRRAAWITVYFHTTDENQSIIDNMTLAWAYFDLRGAWDFEYQKRAAASAVGDMLPQLPGKAPTRDSPIVPFKPRLARVVLSEAEKSLLTERIDRDFGRGAWAGLPEIFKANLWLKGHGIPPAGK